MKVDHEDANKFICPIMSQRYARDFIKCQGADCMAWRWLDYEEDSPIDMGYCGLVGEPKEESK